MLIIVRRTLALASTLAFTVILAGCQHSAPPTAEQARALAAEQQQVADVARQHLEQIPPPSKSLYMAVKSLSAWQNPYVTVQGEMVTLHVMLADANTSTMGLGGMLRPAGARRQDLNVRVSDLATALNAIPEGSWPYGRVIAVEEAHNVPASDRPQVRRNIENVDKTLSDLGIVVYDWADSGRS
ncbi:hypothetical protein [Edaphobacter sp.]|uniref:hypothetical protein n=1 Tax=Edaphobacter sp. TaxID=1934404 RepID=UPI002DBF75D6|nr:hypothetical protein [Edaphobacter sp.]HEU5340841.1 hypothetical protein [Edaphobacter sp.]